MLAKKALGATAAAVEPLYVESVFSTYLYTGNGSTQTITNGIDLSGEGGLVWLKNRTTAYDHGLFDTLRGVGKGLRTNLSNSEFDLPSTTLTAFSSTGFSVGDNVSFNESGTNIVSWTFRKAEKFFDVVTYSGNSTAGRQISHNLGSVPGVIIVKILNSSNDWQVYHRSLGNTKYMRLNTTDDVLTATSRWNDTSPTSTYFVVGNNSSVNATGSDYVAYLFAHDAGGFGEAGDQSVISCGSYTTDASGKATVNLGYEPQWILAKSTSAGDDWRIVDNMRGFLASGSSKILMPNLSSSESTTPINITSTGFADNGAMIASGTVIYIAIRRGPMKTPEVGTNVFAPSLGNSATPAFVGNFPVDLGIWGDKGGWTGAVEDRLRGSTRLFTNNTNAESTGITVAFDNMTGFAGSRSNANVGYGFRRAPGFFDVVCYTGNASAGRQVSHNLGVAPEMMLLAVRNTNGGFNCYHKALGNNKMLQLSTTGLPLTEEWLNNTTPSATYFTVGGGINESNNTGYTYVNYLFASCPGVSKVGSYTGTGVDGLQIDCGFTNGARFVLIKRTDSTGDWYVWDSARGIVAGNDPYLLLNSTAAEVTNTDYIDTYSAGFEISSTAPAAINANGGTFIFLAIA